MKELHLQGRTIEEIADCLKRAPLDPHVITAIKSAYDLGYAFLFCSGLFHRVGIMLCCIVLMACSFGLGVI